MKMRRWILIILWVLSLTLISFYGGAVSYGIFFGITLIPVISLAYLVVVYLQLKLLQQIENRNMVCGQSVPYLFVLKNEGFCAFAGVSVSMFSSFSTIEELPGDREYELLPKDKWTFETKLTCKYRGEYEVGVKEIIMTDFFRLFRISYRIPNAVKAQVRPKLTHVTKLNSIDDLSVLLQKESMRDHTEPDVVVRDYMTGDALKQMHWKATAREQSLKVRNRTGEEKQGIALLWDTKRYSKEPKEYFPMEDKLLETVLALAVFLADKNIPFSAFYGQNGVQRDRIRGIRDFDGFYQKVSDVMFDKDEDVQNVLAELVGAGFLYESKIVFCVLHEISEEILCIAEELDKAGTLTIFYVVTDENVETYIRQSTERHKIMVIPVDSELEGTL